MEGCARIGDQPVEDGARRRGGARRDEEADEPASQRPLLRGFTRWTLPMDAQGERCGLDGERRIGQ
jgi:hypothetical protein